MSDKRKTADEIAAEAAEEMFKGGRAGRADRPRTIEHQRQAPDPLEKGGAGAMPTEPGAALGGLSDKAGGKVMKAEEEEPEKEEKPKKEDEDEDEGEKSMLEADDLLKSLDALDAAAEGLEEEEPDRRAELAKSLADGTLTDDERLELLKSLGADLPTPASDALGKSEDEVVEKGFSDVFAEEFTNDYDASPFLEKFGTAVGAGLDIMREDLVKSANDQRRFNGALAKSIRGVAQVISSQQEMIKSLAQQNTALAQRLGIVEQQPLQRKSLAAPGQARPLQKSFDGQPDQQLDRKQIFDGLHKLMAKYKDAGGRARNGEPIDRAVSSFELSGNISKSLLDEVREVLG